MTLLANTEKKKHPVSFYRFHRVCRLGGCDVEIHTNRKDHYFCCTDHQQGWWKRQRAGDRILEHEVSRQAREIEDLKESVEKLKAT